MEGPQILYKTVTSCADSLCEPPAPQLEELEVTGADYIKPSPVGNFRGVWEELPPETEREDDYGLGRRDNLQVCVCVCVHVVWSQAAFSSTSSKRAQDLLHES